MIKLAMRRNPTVFNPLWAVVFPYVIRSSGKYYGSEYTNRETAFRQIFEENRWLSSESRSGYGSTLAYTKRMRTSLENYLETMNVRVFLDAPCGDFNWMRHVSLPQGASYIGGDIVASIVDNLQCVHGSPTRSFCRIDIVEGPLPRADLWLCRDVLIHLPNEDVTNVLRNFANSQIAYLLTTTHTFPKRNEDIRPGGFRYINLQKSPFLLPPPLSTITDFVAPEAPRYLGLWSRDQVMAALGSGSRPLLQL